MPAVTRSQSKSKSIRMAVLQMIAVKDQFYGACERGDIELAKRLIDRKEISVDTLGRGFRKSCWAGHFEIAKWILIMSSTKSIISKGFHRSMVTVCNPVDNWNGDHWIVALDDCKTYGVRYENGELRVVLKVSVLDGCSFPCSFIGNLEEAKRQLRENPLCDKEKELLLFVIVFYSII